MSRPVGSKNEFKQPEAINSSEVERLEYLAALLLEIVEEDIRNDESAYAA